MANDEVKVHITGDDSGLAGALRRANSAIDKSSKQWKKDFGDLEKVTKGLAIGLSAVGAAGAGIVVKSLREAAKDSQYLEIQLGKLSEAWNNVFAAIGRGLAGDAGRPIDSMADAVQRLADAIDRNRESLGWFVRMVSAVTGLGNRFTFSTPKGLTGPELSKAQADFQLNKNPHLPGVVVDVSDQVRNAKRIREDERRFAEEQARVMAKIAAQDEARFLARLSAGMHVGRESISRMTSVDTLAVSGLSFSSLVPVGRGATPINSRRGMTGRGPSGFDQFIGRLGGGEAAALLAMQGFQGVASGDPLGGLLNTAASAGFAAGGPAGLGIAAGATIIGALSKIFGSSRDREDEAYRAHARALREARDNTPTFVFNFPAGLLDPHNPDWQEAFAETAEAVSGNRSGRFVFTRAN